MRPIVLGFSSLGDLLILLTFGSQQDNQRMPWQDIPGSALGAGAIARQSASRHTGLRMRVTGLIWLRDVVDKLAWKHQVTTDEVEEALMSTPNFRFLERGDVAGEDLYAAMGRTLAGRYLITYFVFKTTGEALIISAREMTKKEKKAYAER